MLWLLEVVPEARSFPRRCLYPQRPAAHDAATEDGELAVPVVVAPFRPTKQAVRGQEDGFGREAYMVTCEFWLSIARGER
jgi:hypothetical protein